MNYKGTLPWSFSPLFIKTLQSAQWTDLSLGARLEPLKCWTRFGWLIELHWIVVVEMIVFVRGALERDVVCMWSHSHACAGKCVHTWVYMNSQAFVLLSGVKSHVPCLTFLHTTPFFPATVSQIHPWILILSESTQLLFSSPVFFINSL